MAGHYFSFHHRILAWLGRLTNTIIISPNPAAIGNASEDYFFGLLRAKKDKKKLLVLFPYEFPGRLKQPSFDPAILYLESDLLVTKFGSLFSVLLRSIWTIYFIIIIIISITLAKYLKYFVTGYYYRPLAGQDLIWRPSPDVIKFDWEAVYRLEWDVQLAKPVQLTLPMGLLEICKSERSRIGLPFDAWFVCLHVREAGYRKDMQNFRNSNIESYYPAMLEITKRGGWVVRMGDNSMKKLPLLERVIDYPFTNVRSALMDVYLIKECTFFIGTPSGIFDTALLLSKPVVMTNAPPFMTTLPLKKGDFAIFKHAYSEEENRFISIQERLSAFNRITTENLSIPDWKLYDNSEEEISAVVLELLKFDSSRPPTVLQQKFKTQYLEALKELSTTFRFANTDVENSNEWYRHASRFVAWSGDISAKFLSDNWNGVSLKFDGT